MQITIHNVNNLKTIDYRKLTNLQGDLKDLTDEGEQKLLAVLQKRGFRAPVFVYIEKGGSIYIMDGHQRQAVMTKYDMSDNGSYKIPYVEIPAKDLQEAQAILLEITSQYGTITKTGLDNYLKLANLPVVETMNVVQFDAITLEESVEDNGKTEGGDEESAPAVDDTKPTDSKYGAVYQLGRHRLMCGDSYDQASVDQLLQGTEVDMFIGDPPYGMRLDADYSSMSASKNTMGSAKKHANVIGDHDDFDASKIWPFIKDIAEHVWFGADYYAHTLPDTEHTGAWGVWDKRIDDNMDAGFGSTFELMWFRQRHKRMIFRYQWFGFFTQGEKRQFEHPTEKSARMIARILTDYCKGSNVLDLFAGGGTTVVACENTNKTCFAMEYEPTYVDIIRRRWWATVNDGDETGWQAATPEVKY